MTSNATRAMKDLITITTIAGPWNRAKFPLLAVPEPASFITWIHLVLINLQTAWHPSCADAHSLQLTGLDQVHRPNYCSTTIIIRNQKMSSVQGFVTPRNATTLHSLKAAAIYNGIGKLWHPLLSYWYKLKMNWGFWTNVIRSNISSNFFPMLRCLRRNYSLKYLLIIDYKIDRHLPVRRSTVYCMAPVSASVRFYYICRHIIHHNCSSYFCSAWDAFISTVSLYYKGDSILLAGL